MPLQMSMPPKVIKKIVFPDSNPGIDGYHASITKILDDIGGVNAKIVSVYEDTAIAVSEQSKTSIYKINLLTKTKTQMKPSISIYAYSLMPSRKGMYLIEHTTYGTYNLYAYSFDNGGCSLISSGLSYSSTYTSYFPFMPINNSYTFFTENNDIIYPQFTESGWLHYYEAHTLKFYKMSVGEYELFPTITEIGSITVGPLSSKVNSLEFHAHVIGFNNNTIRYMLTFTYTAGLYASEEYYYNEYNISTKRFKYSDAKTSGLYIRLDDASPETNDNKSYVPFIYVDPSSHMVLPVCTYGTTGTTVADIPKSQSTYAQTGFGYQGEGITRSVIMEPPTLGLSIIEIMWYMRMQQGVFSTDITPGYYFVSYINGKYSLYYLECKDNS